MKSDSPAATGLVPPAIKDEPGAPAEIRIATGLVVGFGGLVFLAVAAVLALGLWSARTNTIDLLRDKSQAVSQQLVSRIEQYLRPVESQLVHLARQMDRGAIPLDEADLRKYLAGALAATPEVRSLVFIRSAGHMLRALRHADGVDVDTIDVGAMPVINMAMAAGREKPDFTGAKSCARRRRNRCW